MRRVIFFFFFFYPNEQRAGGEGRCQTFSSSFFPCSADHERDWPPCKVVFFGLATNALNVRNNNNNNNNRPLWYILLRYSATTVMYGIFYGVLYFLVALACVLCCDASKFTEHDITRPQT